MYSLFNCGWQNNSLDNLNIFQFPIALKGNYSMNKFCSNIKEVLVICKIFAVRPLQPEALWKLHLFCQFLLVTRDDYESVGMKTDRIFKLVFYTKWIPYGPRRNKAGWTFDVLFCFPMEMENIVPRAFCNRKLQGIPG